MTRLATYFMPYQVRVLRDESPLVIVEKGRQIGLSYVVSYKAVKLAGRKEAKLDVWVVSRDEVQSKQFLLYCKRWARVMNFAAADYGFEILDRDGKPVQVQVLKFANGQCVYCLSSNPDAIVGKSGHVILDEFALHKDQRELYAVAKPVTQWGGTLTIISTHRGIRTVFNDIITDIKERGNKMGWSLHTISIQTAVDQGIVEKIDAATSGKWTNRWKAAQGAEVGGQRSEVKGQRSEVGDQRSVVGGLNLREFWLQQQRAECLDEEQWLQEYCCLPADESTAFITYEMITACEDDTAKRDFAYLSTINSGNSQLFIGFDVARTTDLSVIDVEEKVGDVFWERMRIEMRGKTFAEQESELFRLLALPQVKRACVDSTGLGMQMAERAVARYGYRVEAVRFSANVKEELAFPLRAAHEERRLRYSKDEKLRADLRGIKKETTASGNIRFVGEAADSHCDRFWAKALALHAGKRSGATFNVEIF